MLFRILHSFLNESQDILMDRYKILIKILIFFFLWYSNLRGLFNANAIFEEQQ